MLKDQGCARARQRTAVRSQIGLVGSLVRREAEARLADLERLCAVLCVDTRTAHVYAEVRHGLKAAGRPIPENDVWIAALARQYRLPILSQNRHFDAVDGIHRVGW